MSKLLRLLEFFWHVCEKWIIKCEWFHMLRVSATNFRVLQFNIDVVVRFISILLPCSLRGCDAINTIFKRRSRSSVTYVVNTTPEVFLRLAIRKKNYESIVCNHINSYIHRVALRFQNNLKLLESPRNSKHKGCNCSCRAKCKLNEL